MRVFLCVFYLVLTSGMDDQHPHNQYISDDHSTEAGMLYVNSICKPRETLVKVEHEFPEVMDKGVVPSCVSVQRCGGCCLDEAMVCVSVTNHTTMMQLKQYAKNVHGEMIIELPFVEHSECQCRFRDQPINSSDIVMTS
ncbi:hypothetical protein R3I94_016227 [Phoxinus phoxinus]